MLFITLIFGNASERIIFPLFALVFFDLSSNLVAPETSHATRSYWYGLCMALPSIGNFIASPILSCLSDYYGRKPILVISYLGTLLAGLTTAAAILSQNISLFVLGIGIQGLFSRTNPLGMAAIGDTFKGRNKLSSMGWVLAAIAFGAFIGPILGGYAAHWYFHEINFSAGFLLSALFSLIALSVCLFCFRETLLTPVSTLSFSTAFSSFTLLKKRETIALACILSLEQFTWSLYYQYAPPALKIIRHAQATHIGLFAGLMALWVVLASSIGLSALNRYFKPTQNLTFGLTLQLIGALSIIAGFYLNINSLIWLSSVPAAAGDVITFSVLTTLYSNTYPNKQGQVMGACFLNAAAIWSFTALFGGYLIATNPLLPLYISPITMVIALAINRLKVAL